MSYFWTPAELRLLRQSYRRGGSAAVERSLGRYGFHRTANAIGIKARKLGLQVDPTRFGELIPLADVHPRRWTPNRTSHAHPEIISAARREGVLSRAPVHPRTHLAPRWWVDAYAAQMAQKLHLEAEAIATWLRSEQAARIFDVPLATFRTAASPARCAKAQGLSAALRHVESLRILRPQPGRASGSTKTLYWHPAQTREQAAIYREGRHCSAWHRARRRNYLHKTTRT